MIFVIRSIVISLMIFLALFFTGCGGSTTGTGGVTIEGRILLSNNTSASGIVITVTETGDSAVVDDNSDYVIRTSLLNSYNLLIDIANGSIETTITDVPSNTSRVRANVRIDTDNNSVTDKEIEFEEKEEDDDSNDSSNSGEDASDEDDDSEDDDSDDDDSDDDDSDDENDDSDSDDTDEGDEDDEDDEADEDDDDDDDDDDEEDDDEGNSGCQDKDVIGAINFVNSSSINALGITFAINFETEIEDAEGDEITFSDLATGQIVRVDGECESNLLVAKDIRVEE